MWLARLLAGLPALSRIVTPADPLET
jgi:hypothetical protein